MVLQRQGRPWAAQSPVSVLSAFSQIPRPVAHMAWTLPSSVPEGSSICSLLQTPNGNLKLQCEGNFMIFKILLETLF